MNFIWAATLTLTFLALFHVLFLKPYLKLKSYKKKGAYTYYFPIIGLFAKIFNDFKKSGDCCDFNKKILQSNPDLKLVASNFGSGLLLNFVSPALSKEVLQNYSKYKKGPVFDIIKLTMTRSLIMLEGEEWKARKRVASQVFHFDYLQKLIPDIQDLTNETFSEWKAKKSGQEIDSLVHLEKLIGGIFAVTFFGANIKDSMIEDKPVVIYLTETITEFFMATFSPLAMAFGSKIVKYGLTPFYRRINKKLNVFRSYAANIIQEKKKEYQAKKLQKDSEKKDLLEILLECQESQKEIPDEDLVDEFMAFFTGGTDTSSHVLQTVLYYLDKEPEYKRLLREEAQSVIKDPTKRVTIEQINQLEFTTAVIKEALRKVPPIFQLIQRVALADHYIGEFFVPKGTLVTADFVGLNHHPKLFTNPDKFDPYRWIKSHENFNEEASKDPFVYTPFSAGPRSCIGQPLAMLEMKIILALFASQFDWKVKEGYQLRLMLKFGYEPAEHIPITLIPLQ